MVMAIVFSLVSCGKTEQIQPEETVTVTETEVETTIKIDPTVYAECKIDALKTFTEITGVEVYSVEKMKKNRLTTHIRLPGMPAKRCMNIRIISEV